MMRAHRLPFPSGWGARAAAASSLLLGLTLAISNPRAFPVYGDQTVLPAGTELNEDALDRPREIFNSVSRGGSKSYLVNLGDLAFSSPSILGGAARRAGISCNSCHVNGASNPQLYVPGLSTRHGNFDTTSALFNPKADDGVLNPFRTPSLRGASLLAPYGHDGRIASLREFVRHVIVDEFAGPEPSPAILDAFVVYIDDIGFLPNPSLGPGGRLVAAHSSDAERRGEALFAKPFPHNPELSCSGCHTPSAAFVDHRQHDVGSGGLFKTPTLLNADFNAPYFHDGRFDSYDQVVAHFNAVFDIGLSVEDQRDLVAYLTAVGDGERPYERDGVITNVKEASDFASVLDIAIASRDKEVIALAVETVSGELRETVESFPERKDASVSGGGQERSLARLALKELVLTLRRIDLAAGADRFDDAAAEYKNFRYLMVSAVPTLLTNAEPWSLFNPKVHDAHYAALKQTLQTAKRASP
jgi:Di-haem cytochrome c peroxidase